VKQHDHIGLPRSNSTFLSAAVIFLFTFLCFFPNPAVLSIGSNTGLQAGQILALLSLPAALLLGLPIRHALVLLLLLLPVMLSGFHAMLTASAISNEVALNSTMALGLVFVVLIPAGRIVNEAGMRPLLSGVVWAMVVHLAVGVYQVYRFTQAKFPLTSLYQNPSFRNFISEDPEPWATYVKRPFGLFPEPSAMAASIGPWLVLMIGLLLYPRFRHGMTRDTRGQLILGAVCGMSLILMSSSGFAIWLLVSLLLTGLPVLKNKALRLHRPGSLLAMMAVVLVGVALVYLSFASVGSRLDEQGLGVQGNSSWSARLGSIVWALAYLYGTGPSTLLFGVGPGQSFLMLQSAGSLNLLPPGSGEIPVTAVWSVVVRYGLEGGLLGILALALILIMVLRAIVRSSARLLGLSCLLAWLAGVVLTTSYVALLPIWLFLGVLLGWDRIFEVRATTNGFDAKPDVSSIHKVVKT
jgi:hypothetical protein